MPTPIWHCFNKEIVVLLGSRQHTEIGKNTMYDVLSQLCLESKLCLFVLQWEECTATGTKSRRGDAQLDGQKKKKKNFTREAFHVCSFVRNTKGEKIGAPCAAALSVRNSVTLASVRVQQG